MPQPATNPYNFYRSEESEENKFGDDENKFGFDQDE